MMGGHRKEANWKGHFENMGAKLVSEVASKIMTSRGWRYNNCNGFNSSHRQGKKKNATAGANRIGIRRGTRLLLQQQ